MHSICARDSSCGLPLRGAQCMDALGFPPPDAPPAHIETHRAEAKAAIMYAKGMRIYVCNSVCNYTRR